MSAGHSNVVPLFPTEFEQLSVVEMRCRGLEQDRQSLTELSLHLSKLKREFIEAARDFDVTSSKIGAADPQLRSGIFIRQVEALEARMNQLLGAMTTHQPR